MTLRLEQDLIEKPITEVVDAKAKFVSLVRHGANRQGFRIVKSEEDTGGPIMFVQSILVPKGKSLDDLVSEAPYVRDLRRDLRADRGNYDEYTHIRREAFKEDSLTITPLGASGALVVAGETTQEKTDAVILPVDAADLPVAQITREPLNVSFSDAFFKELDAFVSSTMGAMRQMGADPKDRRKTVVSAWKALGGYLSWALDALDKMGTEEKTKIEETINHIENVVGLAFKQENGNMDEKTKEEIGLIVDEKLKGLDDKLAALAEQLKSSGSAADTPPDTKDKQDDAGDSGTDKSKTDQDTEKAIAEAAAKAKAEAEAASTEKIKSLEARLDELSASLTSGKGAGDETDKNKGAMTPQEKAEKERLEKLEALSPDHFTGGLDEKERAELNPFKGAFLLSTKRARG